MSKPKVLHVLYSGLGGHGSVVFSLLDADIKKKWDSYLLFIGVEPLLKAYSDKCKALKIDYTYFPASPGRPWTYWLKAYRYFVSENPDIIFLHSALTLVPAFLYATRKKKPIVVIEHTPNQVKTSFDWFLTRRAQRWANRIVVLSEVYKDELHSKMSDLFAADKYKLIPNGIDIHKFLPGNKATQSDKIYLGMAARFSHTKDQMLLIRVIANLPDYLRQKISLSLAGDGEFLEDVKELSLSLRSESHVSFKGNLSESELISWFQDLDVYVHASKGETMCTAIMQAMACGLPIVASDIPGINNLVPSSAGILIDHKEETFMGALIKVINDTNWMYDAGVYARKYAETEFSHITMFRKYDRLVEELLEKEKL